MTGWPTTRREAAIERTARLAERAMYALAVAAAIYFWRFA